MIACFQIKEVSLHGVLCAKIKTIIKSFKNNNIEIEKIQ